MRRLVFVALAFAVSGCPKSASSGGDEPAKDEAKSEKKSPKKGDDDDGKKKPKKGDDDGGKKKPKSDPAADEPEAAAPAKKEDATVVDLAVGHYRACVARADGKVVCWGHAMTGEAASEAPMAVIGLADATKVAGDDGQFCALREKGKISCWGLDMKAKPIAVKDAIETDGRCGLVDGGGKVTCWSLGDDGKVAFEPFPIDKPKKLGRGANACVIDEDGDAWCRGSNQYHQLGDGTTEERATPVKVKGLAKVDEIGASAFERSCARVGGKVLCWGGEGSSQITPVALKGIADAKQLAVGEYHSCALLASGKIACWGSNSNGQLGVAGETAGADPVTVPGISDARLIEVGGGEPAGGAGTTCALTKSGEVLCWGAMYENKHAPTKVDLAPKKPAAKTE